VDGLDLVADTSDQLLPLAHLLDELEGAVLTKMKKNVSGGVTSRIKTIFRGERSVCT
jgi:hypothetical protein